MTIHVTQQDIYQGECGEPFHCAIAQAVCRTFGTAVMRVCVGNGGILARDWDMRILFQSRITLQMAVFMQMFDRDKSSVQPFSFEIPDHLIPESLRPAKKPSLPLTIVTSKLP